MLVFKQHDIYDRMQLFIAKHSGEIKADNNVDSLMYLNSVGITKKEALYNFRLNRMQKLKKKFEKLFMRFCQIKLQTKNILILKDLGYPYQLKVTKAKK